MRYILIILFSLLSMATWAQNPNPLAYAYKTVSEAIHRRMNVESIVQVSEVGSEGTYIVKLRSAGYTPNGSTIIAMADSIKALVLISVSAIIENGDTTIFAAIVDSTNNTNNKVIVARNNKLSSDTRFLWNFNTHKLSINTSNGARGGSVKLYVEGNTMASAFIRNGGAANQFQKGDGSIDTFHYVKSVRANGTDHFPDTATGRVDLGTLSSGSIDTGRGVSQIATGGSLNKVRDSVQNNIPTNNNQLTNGSGYLSSAVTSFSKTDNWGITSSVTNPATTPNYAAGVDSATLSTYYLRRKDSISYATIKRLADTAATKNFKLGWYNVVDYGADTTGTTDATTAIQNAINDAAAHGGGTVYFRKGTYKIAGAYKTTDGNGHNVNTAQIYIPLGEYVRGNPLFTIKLLGEVAPNAYMNFGDSIPNPKTGVVLKSTATTAGAVIGSAYTGVVWGSFNYTQLEMENITIRARSKRSNGADTANIQTGIDASAISMLRLNNIRIDNESIDTLSLQPATGSFGIKTPAANNFANTYITDVRISGYNIGMTVNEHTTGDNIFINTCVTGLQTNAMIHGASFNRLLIAWCVNNIKINAKSYLNIRQLDIEDYPGTGSGNYASRWYNFTNDLYEPSLTSSYVNIIYHRVTSGIGEANAGFVNNTLSNNIFVEQVGKPGSRFLQDLSVTSTLATGGNDYTGTFNSNSQFNGIQINNTSGTAVAESYIGLAKNGTNLFQLDAIVGKKQFGLYDNKTATYFFTRDSLGTVAMADGSNTTYPVPTTYPFVLQGKSLGLNVLSPKATLDVNSSGTHVQSGVDTLAKFTSSSQYPIIVLNGTNANSGSEIIWQKNGVNTFQLGNDLSGNGTKDFFIYDATNAKAKAYISSAGVVQLGNTANSSPNLTIADGAAGSVTTAGKIIAGGTVRLKAYTVATLPTGTTGDVAYVTDASSPAWNTTVAGGGSSVITVFYNGSNWVCK